MSRGTRDHILPDRTIEIIDLGTRSPVPARSSAPLKIIATVSGALALLYLR